MDIILNSVNRAMTIYGHISTKNPAFLRPDRFMERKIDVSYLARKRQDFSYFFTAMACSSKWPPARSDPAPMNSRAG